MSHWSLWSASSVGGWLGGSLSECITYVRVNVKRIRPGVCPWGICRWGICRWGGGAAWWPDRWARGVSRGSHDRRCGSGWGGEQEEGACQIVSPWQ